MKSEMLRSSFIREIVIIESILLFSELLCLKYRLIRINLFLNIIKYYMCRLK